MKKDVYFPASRWFDYYTVSRQQLTVMYLKYRIGIIHSSCIISCQVLRKMFNKRFNRVFQLFLRDLANINVMKQTYVIVFLFIYIYININIFFSF